MANRFPLIFNSGAGQIQELAASDNLDLTSSNLVNAGILFTSSGSATAPSLQIGSGTTYNSGLYSPGTDQLAISTNGTGRLFIDATGNVGVNTASPSTYGKFAVVDTQNGFLSSTFVNTSSGVSAVNRIQIGNDSSNGAGQLVVYGSQHSTLANIFDITNANPAALRLLTNNAERARIRSDGTFEIKGAGTAGSSPGFSVNPSTPANSFVIDSSGRLGIGSSSPAQLLHVQKDQAAVTFARFDNQSNNSSAYAGIQLGAFGNTWGIACGSSSANSNALVFVLDPNTSISAGEKMRIDSSGRLLVGTTISASVGISQYARLQVQGNTFGTPEYGIVSIQRSEAAANITSGEDIGRISFADNAGNDFAQISCSADANAGAGDFPGRLLFSVTKDGAPDPTGRAMIDNRGAFHMFAVAGGDGHIFMTGEGAGTTYYLFAGFRSATSVFGASAAMVFQVFTNGNTQNTNNSYAGISDLKLKENIVDATSQWDDLKALQVRKYNFKEETGHQTHTQIGLVAQEVELVSPGLVNESPDRETIEIPVLDSDGNQVLDQDGNPQVSTEERETGTVTKSVNYSVLYMKAVKALQEAMERIEQLETSNIDLLARVIALETA